MPAQESRKEHAFRGVGKRSSQSGQAGTYHMREILRVLDSHVQQLDVEELVDRVQRATDCQVCGASRVGWSAGRRD